MRLLFTGSAGVPPAGSVVAQVESAESASRISTGAGGTPALPVKSVTRAIQPSAVRPLMYDLRDSCGRAVRRTSGGKTGERISNQACVSLDRALVDRGPIPQKAAVDALHIAIATVHGMDYVLLGIVSTSPTRKCKRL